MALDSRCFSRFSRSSRSIAALLALAVAGWCLDSGRAASAAAQQQTNWAVIGGSADNTHYSPLAQIDTRNVAGLKVAWTLDTGERGGMETTPIMVDGVLYTFTPSKNVIAIDAVTGKLLWTFAPGIYSGRPSRGVTYWRQGDDKRIIAGVMNYVYELDATTGKFVPTFGANGRIDLREGLGRVPAEQSLAITSPAVVYKDLFIVGAAMPETLPAPPGDIRAYDVRTGKMRWIFHTIPHPGEFGYDTWPKDAWTYSGAANNWCGMTVDQQRGIVFVPTGSAATDWYGANRAGDDLFADTLLALDASTGTRIWHFQGVHHDLWDRDFPAPPVLFALRRNGKDIPALAQTTKEGFVFVFDRTNGHPLYPIEERKIQVSSLSGEVSSATQPFAPKPEPYARMTVTENDLTTRTPEAHAWALNAFHNLVSQGPFTPVGTHETIIAPGNEGGGEWGGPALDPDTNILYVNSNEFVYTESLFPEQRTTGGRATYLSQCAACHGSDLAGVPSLAPPLAAPGKKLTDDQIKAALTSGKGRMPAFPDLRGQRLEQLLSYLSSPNLHADHAGDTVSYDSNGYRRFDDPDGYPATAMPWGRLNAINLNTGEYVWRIPFGEYPELVAKGLTNTGSPNFGGPLVTRGGLLVIGATIYDSKLRIFDKANGKLLWEKVLPYPATATPLTYEVNGKQYIVVASGGERVSRGPTGGIYYAFVLP